MEICISLSHLKILYGLLTILAESDNRHLKQELIRVSGVGKSRFSKLIQNRYILEQRINNGKS